jgi:hypothetical protein
MTGQRAAEKVTGHPRRGAYLYVRPVHAAPGDGEHHLHRPPVRAAAAAVALGWVLHQITVIDEDLGRSGATSQGRDGFQRLVADAGMGQAGIVIGWRSPGWPATTPAGTGCWKSARSPRR